jgi:hypothetical protein
MTQVREVMGVSVPSESGQIRASMVTNGVAVRIATPIKSASISLSISEARHLAKCLYTLARKAQKA